LQTLLPATIHPSTFRSHTYASVGLFAITSVADASERSSLVGAGCIGATRVVSAFVDVFTKTERVRKSETLKDPHAFFLRKITSLTGTPGLQSGPDTTVQALDRFGALQREAFVASVRDDVPNRVHVTRSSHDR